MSMRLKESPRYKDLVKLNDTTWKYKDKITIGYNEYGKYYFVIEPDELDWMYSGESLKDLLNGIDNELEDKVDESMKLKEEFIPNDFGFDCPKCHSKKYVQIEDGENGYGNPEYHFECKDCGYISEVSEIDAEDLDEVYQQDIILDEDIKETEYNVVIDNIEWSAENEDLPSSIQHDFFLSPYDNLEDEVYRFLLEYSNGVAPLGYSIDYNSEDYYIKDDDYIGDEDKAYHTESLDDEYWSPEENPLDDRYDYIDSKMVYDSDGMITEYTMYYDTLDNKYVFVFGDSDLYKPEDEDFDWECETRDEAEAWFNAYNGFEDDLDECNLKEAQGQNLYLKLRDEIKNSNNIKYLKNLDKKLVDEYLKSLNVDEKQALHHYIVLQIRKINDKSLNEDTIKQNGKWVNKGKEGTHGTFKTKKQADAQRKAMFANGYREDLNEARDYESEYNITPADKKKIIQWWKDMATFYEDSHSKEYVAGIDELYKTNNIDDIDGWLISIYDSLVDLSKYIKNPDDYTNSNDIVNRAKDLLRKGKLIYNKYVSPGFNYGIKESKQLNEKDYYADKTIGRYRINPSKRVVKLKQRDGRNYGSIGSRPYVEFEDITLTWEDIDGMNINHSDIFEWFKAFKDGRVDKALDNKLNNSQNNKSLKEEASLPKGKMITNEKGISYYQRGNKYYSNTGWLEKEINKDDFDKALNDYNKLDAIERMVADDFADGNVRYSFEKFKKRFDRYSYEEATEDNYNYYLRKVNELNGAQWPEEEDNIDECNLKEDYFDDKEFITLSEEDQKQFEQLMNDNGWILDDETARYGSKNFYDAWFHKEGDGAQDIHYQFITKDTYTEDEWDELMDNTFDLLDECEKEFNTRIRFSAGLINDGSKYNGRGTIGIDIDAPELVIKGEDKVPAELAGHKVRLKNGKPYGKDSEDVIKDIEDHGFDVSQMGVKKDESLNEDRKVTHQDDVTFGRRNVYDYYELGKFDGVEFTATYSQMKNDVKENKYYVQSIHPYNNAEYHWAYSNDGKNWRLYIDSPGKLKKQLITQFMDFDTVAKELLKLDKEADIKPIRAIW